MTSLEGIFRELFLRGKQASYRTLWGGVAMYLLLACGYLRDYAKTLRNSPAPVLPSFPGWGRALRGAIALLPMGLFYIFLPMVLAWGLSTLLGLAMLYFLVPFVWGVLMVFGCSLMAVALCVVEDDPERFFLGIAPEEVFIKTWKIKRYLVVPALACYGLGALLGPWFYGFSFFIALAVLTTYADMALEQ